MCKIVFVVLHYENLKDTKECLLSLLKYQKNKNVSIVLVDNGSKSQTIKSLQSEYQEKKNIYFLYTNKNLGFSKGNNMGFKFAKKQLKADIIILSNNDIIYPQNDYIQKLVFEYKKGFDIAGPNIISKYSLERCNPVPIKYKSVSDVRKRIFKFYVLYGLSFFYLDNIFRYFIHLNKQPVLITTDKVNFQLHGACLIFSGEYINKFNGLYNKTFMYEEESILKFISDKQKLRMKYFDKLLVVHKEGSSTKKVHGDKISNRRFYYKCSLDSCKVLLKMMKGKLQY
ncbi:glycosyltransferase family 2 protein [Liquorilactobacillus nagelii]|uniref:glycosyltransferase family 2 protein n=1 Tax=Liquorilactobacillus nagelii TaxID=82688 RepID=UPI0039EA4F6B